LNENLLVSITNKKTTSNEVVSEINLNFQNN